MNPWLRFCSLAKAVAGYGAALELVDLGAQDARTEDVVAANVYHRAFDLRDPSAPYTQVDGGWERRRRLPKRLAAGAVLSPSLAELLLSRRRPGG